MARPVWKGTISFGLIAIPVTLYHAVSKKQVSFNQLDDRSMSRIRYRKVSAATGEEVPDEHIVKGYEVTKGRYVVVEPEELDRLMPKATKSIDLDEFVALEDIDPVYFDTPYIVAPAGATKPYALLARAMEESGKVAIGRFVMRNNQYVAAIRAVDGTLRLSTLVFADEVVNPVTIEGLADAAEIEVSGREMVMAQTLVESLTTDFDGSQYRDTYREQLLDMIRRKGDGEEFDESDLEDEEPTVIDLMAALEQSVAAAKAARGRHPSTATPAKKRSSKSSAKAASAKGESKDDAKEDAPAKRRVRKSA
jgi:DNA end-binding protein Ku